MDNPEKLAPLGAQDAGRRQTKQIQHYIQIHTLALLQTTGGKDEPKIAESQKTKGTKQDNENKLRSPMHISNF